MRLFPQSRAAFAIPDLLGLLVVLAVAASLALAATRQMRQEAMTASSLSQLRWLAGATSSYAADSNDQFWSYSWRAGPLPHSDPTLPATASGDLVAAMIQSVDILRRLTGRSDLPTGPWIPHVRYNHLPLVDYLGSGMPDFNLLAPGDKHRLNWARDPAAFERGEFLPFQPEPGLSWLWPYSSSYQVPAAMYDLSPVGNRVNQVGVATHGYTSIPGSTLGGVDLTSMRYPSQKVMLHDVEQRELGAGSRYCVDVQARAPVLMGDGAASIAGASQANLGWNPNSPSSGWYTRFRYVPEAWEAPEPAGQLVDGRYRWTRGGIEGRDFGGPEVDTGQP